MTSLPLMRTEYWNPSTNTVRGGATAHGESLTDVENYLLPQAQMTGASLFTRGVADGLSVSASANQPGLTIAPGVALDANGHLIALAANGFAIVDPSVDPNQIQNIPTVPVAAGGVSLSSTGISGDCFLTIMWREILGQSQLANAPVLIHAPWLRLLAAAGFLDDGEQVILARVSLDPSGLVTALTADGRRLAGLSAGHLELRRPRSAALPTLAVDQLAASELRARADGGLEVNVLPVGGGAPLQPLAIEGTTGNLWLAAQSGKVGIGTTNPSVALEIDRGAGNDPALKLTSSGPGWGSGLLLSNKAAGGKTYGSYSGNDGKWHFADQDNAADRLVIDGAGNLGIGTVKPSAALEIDRGATNDLALRLTSSGPGWGSGLQLSNQAAGGKTYGSYSGSDGNWHFADQDNQVDRLVIDQSGNLAIGIGAGQAQRTVHIEGSEVHSGGSGGGFSFMNRGTPGFVNMPGAGERWVWYAFGGSARLWSGGDKLTISPTGEGGGLDVPRRMRVRQGGDSSAGIWFLQSAPQADRAFVGMADDTHVGFWGNTGAAWGLRMDTSTGNVGIGTGTPGNKLEVRGGGTAISGHGGDGLFDAGVFGEGHLGVWASGRTTGILATGPNLAGAFWGNVSITGTLSKGGGGFKIDHPLEPANKYLSHSFVESPEMLNVYNGNITTDGQGEVTVELPDYFAALNRDYRYQLTVIGQMAQAIVASEIKDSRFTIRTDKPNVMVSWQVMGIRQDPWANANRIPVEETKPEAERAFFLHPEVHNQPPERGILQARYGEQAMAQIRK
jgi:hypothetical protein